MSYRLCFFIGKQVKNNVYRQAYRHAKPHVVERGSHDKQKETVLSLTHTGHVKNNNKKGWSVKKKRKAYRRSNLQETMVS